MEDDLQEAEAKNRLYTLLLERTRREHMAIDQQVCGQGPTAGVARTRLHLGSAPGAGCCCCAAL